MKTSGQRTIPTFSCVRWLLAAFCHQKVEKKKAVENSGKLQRGVQMPTSDLKVLFGMTASSNACHKLFVCFSKLNCDFVLKKLLFGTSVLLICNVCPGINTQFCSTIKQISDMPIFWVLVFQEPNKRYIVTFGSVIEEALRKEPSGNCLLYIRMFTSMQDAVGHKLFLEKLSNLSMVAIIRTINPKQRDIRPFLELFHTGNNVSNL